MQEPYNSFSSYLKKRFKNQKIRKIPINAGFSCPNKNGRLSDSGCIFCDVYGSGPIKMYKMSIPQQIRGFIGNHTQFKYIAYYQAHSNTNAPVEKLKKKYEIIFDFKEIVGLFIGTRPDSIEPEVYNLLESLNRRTYLSVELGLQSVHAKSLDYLNRNHTYGQFLETFSRLKEKQIDVVVHLIVGIPGEDKKHLLATIQEMNRLKPAGIKFHLLHVLRNTRLFDLYKKGELNLLERDEYIDLIITMLENLDPSIVIHRLTGERDKEIFYAPQWAMEKGKVIQLIRNRMAERQTYQGKCFSC
jgi:radical SAM protein (TIGR01212 family)